MLGFFLKRDVLVHIFSFQNIYFFVSSLSKVQRSWLSSQDLNGFVLAEPPTLSHRLSHTVSLADISILDSSSTTKTPGSVAQKRRYGEANPSCLLENVREVYGLSVWVSYLFIRS